MGDLPIRYGKIKNKEAGAVLRSRPCSHRFDESPTDYSWASCSPAELACALSAGAFCYTGTPFVNPLSANGQPCLISVSHIRGKVQERLSYLRPAAFLVRVRKLPRPRLLHRPAL